MFIINLTYKAELEQVDKYLQEHVNYLNTQYELGNFLMSGRKIPRSGGVIISPIREVEQLNEILNQDPFKINDIANYEVTEFVASKTREDINFLTEE